MKKICFISCFIQAEYLHLQSQAIVSRLIKPLEKQSWTIKMRILTEMSKMESKKIETKSFSEIWLGLNSDERSELCRRLLLARCCTTYQTVWNWGKGKARPLSPLIKDKVATTVSKFLDKKTSHQILFPTR